MDNFWIGFAFGLIPFTALWIYNINKEPSELDRKIASLEREIDHYKKMVSEVELELRIEEKIGDERSIETKQWSIKYYNEKLKQVEEKLKAALKLKKGGGK